MTSFKVKLFRDGEDLIFLLPEELVRDWEIEEGNDVEWSLLDNKSAVLSFPENRLKE